MLQLGRAYNVLGQSQQGTELLQQALTIAQEIGETELAQRIQRIVTPFEYELFEYELYERASPQKKEADRLLNQGIQQYQTSQYPAAIASWEQALAIYREIKDRNGEANSFRTYALTEFP